MTWPAFEPIRSYMPQPPGGPVSTSKGMPDRLPPTMLLASAGLARVHAALLAEAGAPAPANLRTNEDYQHFIASASVP